MEYKKINIKKYLLFYLIITIITFGTVFILKIIDKNKKEIIATQIENSRQNNIITDNLIYYIGKVVNWHTINEETKNIDWQILYADKEGTYLIAKDYINIEKQAPDFPSVYMKYNSREYQISFSNTYSKELIEYLNNNELWSKKYVSSKNDIKWVKGTPTMELYTQGHNAKYGTDFACFGINNIWYDKPTSNYSKPGIIQGDGIFYLKNSDKQNILWLSAINNEVVGSTDLWAIDNNNGCFISLKLKEYGGLRPVIAIRPDVKLEIVE